MRYWSLRWGDSYPKTGNLIRRHTIVRFELKTKYILCSLGFLCFLISLLAYWKHEQHFPSTEDAYLQAHITPIAAQVTGKVSKIYVHDNQIVAKNDSLFHMDPLPFQIAVDKAKANLELVEQQVAGQENTINIAKSTIAKFEAQLIAKEKNNQRIQSLVSQGRAPRAQGDDALESLREVVANLQGAKDEYQRAQKLLGKTGPINAQIRLARAQLQQAELDLQHTLVTAPSDGKVTQLSLREGAPVNQNQSLFSLVALNHWWIKANFKETAVSHVLPGQPVKVQVDMYPGIVFRGIVESIGAGSDAVFSLFPPENASGNWVKVTQRIPVKIQLVNPDPKYPLRIGTSSKVIIDARQMSG
jgi:membrane fusion protein (multidrug efflux system)